MFLNIEFKIRCKACWDAKGFAPFNVQARIWRFAANTACGPHDEQGRKIFPYSIALELL